MFIKHHELLDYLIEKAARLASRDRGDSSAEAVLELMDSAAADTCLRIAAKLGDFEADDVVAVSDVVDLLTTLLDEIPEEVGLTWEEVVKSWGLVKKIILEDE